MFILYEIQTLTKQTHLYNKFPCPLASWILPLNSSSSKIEEPSLVRGKCFEIRICACIMSPHSDLHSLETTSFLQMRQGMTWVHMQLQVT